ncbi:hypothetical protein [Mesorhizobium sangaii]|uniref:Uncharacterized protein n=1 Tax=Mesorhizobium sangaii TaxID=505389 RepID=A0A841PDY3_9HYPH|nr:hypothetical protein [Mesorhizobium sangaii]MBB6413534.1 hypothetical protein [Mesorhizobium sangaii]
MISELGVARYPNLRWGDYWAGYLEKIELRDLLDSVTLCYSTIQDYDGRPDQRARQEFVNSVPRIFGEEGVRYSVDDRAGVHFALDVEFERSRISTVAVLGGARYKGVRTLFYDAYTALDGAPPDGKAAIRSSFLPSRAFSG